MLRRPLPSDEPFLLAITERLADFPVPPWRTAAMIATSDHAILLDALHRPNPETLMLVAEPEPGRPAGFIFATSKTDYFTGERYAHIEVLAVLPEMERRGIGRSLMDAAEAWATSRGYGQMTLNVFAQNEGARAVYDRLGYQPELVRYWKALAAAGGGPGRETIADPPSPGSDRSPDSSDKSPDSSDKSPDGSDG